MDLESTVMELIISAGEARSCAFEALQFAKNGHYDESDHLLEKSKQALNLAHGVQTKLIESDEGKGKINVTLVMVHAQDHLMTSILCHDLIKEMIELYKR